MADAILDEYAIIALLRCPPLPETANRIQGGAAQALMDMYDRKVSREEFVSAASTVLALYASAGRLTLLQSMHDLLATGNLTVDKFVAARSELDDLIRAQTETVVDLVKRMQLIPPSSEPLH